VITSATRARCCRSDSRWLKTSKTALLHSASLAFCLNASRVHHRRIDGWDPGSLRIPRDAPREQEGRASRRMKFANKKNLPRARTRQNSRDVINTAADSVNYRILKGMLRLLSDDAGWTARFSALLCREGFISMLLLDASLPLPFHLIDLHVS